MVIQAQTNAGLIAFTEEEVRFTHETSLLVGTLRLPATSGPHPALVMIQGSGPTDRTNFGYFPAVAEHFARNGFAVLCYDKPGEGQSTGNWRQQTLRDRAHEALAAVHFLQNRAEIRSERVGLWGISQGGWVVPLAASLSSDVAFIVPVSGPGVSPAEQDVYGIEQTSRATGFSEEQIQSGLALYRRFLDAARRGEYYEQISAVVRETDSLVFNKYMGYLDATSWSFFSGRDPVTDLAAVDYDPKPALEQVRCPVLAVFGERDLLVPVAASVAIYEHMLTEGGNTDFRIDIFPDADHGIKVDDGSRFAPGYLETMTEWIREQTTPANHQPWGSTSRNQRQTNSMR